MDLILSPASPIPGGRRAARARRRRSSAPAVQTSRSTSDSSRRSAAATAASTRTRTRAAASFARLAVVGVERAQPGGLADPPARARRGRLRLVSPALYRGLVRAALKGLRASGHGSDDILMGETAPIGASRVPPRPSDASGAVLASAAVRRPRHVRMHAVRRAPERERASPTIRTREAAAARRPTAGTPRRSRSARPRASSASSTPRPVADASVAGGHLVHGVRLPDRSARPHLRRLAHPAGDLAQPGRLDRLARPASGRSPSTSCATSATSRGSRPGWSISEAAASPDSPPTACRSGSRRRTGACGSGAGAAGRGRRAGGECASSAAPRARPTGRTSRPPTRRTRRATSRSRSRAGPARGGSPGRRRTAARSSRVARRASEGERPAVRPRRRGGDRRPGPRAGHRPGGARPGDRDGRRRRPADASRAGPRGRPALEGHGRRRGAPPGTLGGRRPGSGRRAGRPRASTHATRRTRSTTSRPSTAPSSWCASRACGRRSRSRVGAAAAVGLRAAAGGQRAPAARPGPVRGVRRGRRRPLRALGGPLPALERAQPAGVAAAPVLLRRPAADAAAPPPPPVYRRLVRAAYPAVRSADPGAQVLIGALAPRGRPARPPTRP